MPMIKGMTDHPEIWTTEITIGDFPYVRSGDHWVLKDDPSVRVPDPISLSTFIKKASAFARPK
jgi:hypothetical protein